jgi:hypothetical protein
MPLIRSGGVFLILVGAAIAAGALWYKRRYVILALGAVVGSVALAVLAAPLSSPYGPPSLLQLSALSLAVLFEAAALFILVPRAARRGERALTVTILAIVGAHFLIMTPAFGPLIFVLGAANLINALIGARLVAYPAPALWVVDGVLKAAVGVAMYASH